MTTALARGDTNGAREAFFTMPTTVQNESITRYLAFKLALKSEDSELAMESLSIVTKHAKQDPTFLYACVLEAQRSKMRHLAVAALQAIVDKQPAGVHLPSLLRCTARLLIGELDSPDRSFDEAVEEVVKLFERAGSNTRIFKDCCTDEQRRTEIQWWSKNAFNLALRLCDKIHPKHLVRLLAVCVTFLDSYPDDGVMHQENVARRRLLCHFLSATALVVLARSSAEDPGYSMQCYIHAREHVARFLERAHKLDRASDDQRDAQTADDMRERTFELLKFDMEGVLKLQQWDDLDRVVQAFLNFEGTDRWDNLADLVIVVHDQSSAANVTPQAAARIPELLQKCINETWKREKDIGKMSRWLRITFTIHLEGGSDDFALKIVQQAANVAQRGQEGQKENYPNGELQWLATTAFNRAVDALAMGDADAANKWVDAALGLARYADDNGALHANLTFKKREADARLKHRVGDISLARRLAREVTE